MESSGRKNDALPMRWVITGFLAVLLINVGVMNDVATIWDGAEANLVGTALFEESSGSLPALLTEWISGGALREFLIRLPGALFFIAAGVGSYFLALPVLGATTTLRLALILGSSFLMPNLAKVASLDSWAFGWQMLAFWSMLRFVKAPAGHWRWLTYVLLGPALWTAPLSSLLFFSIFPVLLYLLHPQGRELLRLQPWPALLVWLAVLYFSGLLEVSSANYYFWFDPGRFFLYNFLSVLPFLGFLAGGFADTAGKLRRKGEFAIIVTALLVAALLGQSLLLQLGFCLLIARQTELYFVKNYPYRDIVRSITVIHLVLAFFFAMALMMGGFLRFEGVGFRSGLALGVVYWIGSFICVIGLFGMKKRLVIGGMVAGALLTTTSFWLEIYPLIESKRNIARQMAGEVLEATPARLYFLPEQPGVWSNEQVYLKSDYPDLVVWSSFESFEEFLNSEEPGIAILPSGNHLEMLPEDVGKTIEGSTDWLQPVSWLVVEKGAEKGR